MGFYFNLFFLIAAIIVIGLLVALYFWGMEEESKKENQ
jgi:hypothetical protein